MILVTGAKGQVGGDVCKILENNATAFIGIDIEDLDLTDELAVKAFFDTNHFDAVIHCAAYTAVDNAEDNTELCMKVNVNASEYLAKNAQKQGAKMLYISTDYVFSGEGTAFFEVDDEKSPQNAYGISKHMGELAVKQNCDKFFIVRTSWVFGEKNTNFIATMLRLSEKLDTVKVVCDQIGSPTYSNDLAKCIVQMVKTEFFGEYHATNEGLTSWDELARFVFGYAKKDVNVISVTSSEYPTKATRPLNSRLSKSSLTDNGFALLPCWQDSVTAYLKNILG